MRCPTMFPFRPIIDWIWGINFRKTTKRGFERIWNISIYNAYCRMNAFYTQVERQADGSFRGKAIGLFPVIPSFSYTLKF